MLVVDLLALGDGFAMFWTERHICTFSSIRVDGTPHVTPVGVTVDLATATAYVITSAQSQKAHIVRAAGVEGAPVAACQVDGRRWSTLEGIAVLRTDPGSIADAERRYTERYRPPRANPHRVVLEITVHRVLGNV